MARISTYPIIVTPTLNDLLIGTDVENLNNTKNFTVAELGNLIGESYVPYVGATGNVNLGAFSIEAAAFIVPGGLASQFVKADGSLDSTSYVPFARTLTINGTTYDLSANRTWSLPTIDTLTTTGTGGAATYSAGTLNIPIYQSQGNYITQLSGEATASGPGNATVTLDNAAVIAKVLSGLNITGGSVVATDSILTAFGKVQNQINSLVGGVQYQGTWNAATNTPFLQSSVGTKGYYYVVSVPGNTDLNGVTDWRLGDWAIFDGTAWSKVDNTDAVVSVNGYTGAVVLTYSDVGAPPATRTLTINGTGYDLSTDRSWTVGDVRTDQSYADPVWITSLDWGKIINTPTTLGGYGITDAVEDSTTLTINGTGYDLSANRTWNVGTVTSVATSGPLTGGTITTSGTIGITQAGPTSDGYLSAADWNEFNEKLNDLSATAPITYSAGVIGITQSGVSSNGYLSSTDWNTFNNKQNALTNPVTGTGTAYTLPMWSGLTTLIDSSLSYAASTFRFEYNSPTGGAVTFVNIDGVDYAYTITMNNFGSPRSTVHNYTDGVVVQSIGATQVSKIFANGNTIIGDGVNDTGYKLTIEGDLYIETITNAATDTDKFLVSDSGVIKYRTGSEVLSDIGAVPTTRQLTINGTSYDLSADRSWSVGTVTSVDMSVPAGFTISGNPVTGSGTLAVAFAAGYSLPTNATQATWTTAYNDSIISASVTGTTTKTLTLNQQDGGTIQVSWSDFDTAPVTSVFGRTGDVIAQSGDYSTTLVTEGTNLYYLDSRARAAISSTATGLTYTTLTGVLSLTAGYSIPTTASQLTWDTAYNDSIVSAAVTGTTTKTLTLNQQDGGTVTASWTDYDTAPVTSVFGRTGAVVAQSGDYSTTLVTEGTNLYFTDSRARSAISLTTLGSSGPATYSNLTGVLNIPDYGSVLTGYVPYTGATQDVDLGSYGLITDFVRYNLSSSNIPSAAGVMWWDNIEGTIRLSLKGNTYNLPIGESVVARVRNSTGGNLSRTAYQAVRVAGAQGQRLAVALAQANNDPNSASTLGLVCEDISTNQEGFIVNIGQIVNVNTTGNLQGETWLDGDVLYLSPTTPGAITNIKPAAPQHTVIIGYVEYSHANNGKIYVKVDNGYELEELHDVAPTPYINNGVLYRDTATNLWKSATIATLLGYTPANQAITLTINGTTYDLSANRTWNVGTVTSITAGSGLDGGTITTSGTISHADTSSQTSVDNAGGTVIQDVSLDTFGHVTGLASVDLDLRYVPLTRTLNGLALSSNQTFATGTTGTDFNIVSAGTVHTFNIPDASASARGFVNATTQTIGGAKTFTASPTAPSYYLTNMGAGSGALYYNTAESRLTLANYNVGGKVMIEVNGGNYTMSLNADLSIQLIGYTTNGILKTSGSNGTLIVDTTAYTPQSRTLTINGTAYDLSADRSWSVGTVTSVGLSVPTGFSIGSSPVTGSGTLALTFASGYSLPTNAVQAEWDEAYDNRITSLTTTGTSGAATLVSNVLNIPQYQAQGNYITSLTGEATASGPGAASVTLSNSAVTGKVLTGLTVTGTTISATDSILTAFGKLQGQINSLIGGLQYQGTWNANTNSPTITSGVGTEGYFYIVSVAGNTTIDGVSGWQVGDWIVFDGTAWQKVDNTDSVTSVNGFTGAVTLTTTNISEGTNLYFTDSRARSAISLTTTGSSGAATYSNLTGVLNVPQYTLAGLGGVPTTRNITINGLAQDLSTDRSWSVGTVTSVATSGPITGGTITSTGTIGITQSGTSSDGYLSSTDWNTFNNKQATITLTTTGNSGSSTFVSNTLNIPNYTLSGLGGVPDTRTITINGLSQDLSVNRTWSVGTVTSITFSGPLTGGTITGSGTVGILQSSGSQDGYLSSTDWTTFNNKQSSISVTAPITLVGTTIAITQSGASSNGYLSSTDWTTFNNKQNAITLTTTGTSGAATLVGATLNIPQYQSVLTNPVTGTGTTNYLSKFTGASAIGDSLLYDDGSAIGLGTATINAAALFQMDSTTRGFLPPRMTQAQRQAIATVPEGLIVYQTNGVIGLYIYANGTWRSLTMV
jgi:predicted heme/steroid binding protein